MNILETPRLLLRDWRITDAGDLFEYASIPEIGQNAGWKPHESFADSLSAVGTFIALGEIWAVEYKDDNKVIGSIGMHSDNRRPGEGVKMLGFTISKRYWGRGLATEAAAAVIEYAFSLPDVLRLTGYHYPGNIKSGRVFEKCGFRMQGILKAASRSYGNKECDEVCYSLNEQEWQALRSFN